MYFLPKNCSAKKGAMRKSPVSKARDPKAIEPESKFLSILIGIVHYSRQIRFSIMHFLSAKRRLKVWQVGDFNSYDDYVKLQMSKTADPIRRSVWLGKEWQQKIDVFSKYFEWLFSRYPINRDRESRALCVGARTGQEVVALRQMKLDAIGIDLVPNEPYVIFGDFHSISFDSGYFQFVFTNVFDHAFYPDKLIEEMERVTAKNGLIVVHLSLKSKTDSFGVTEVGNLQGVLELFKSSKVLSSNKLKSMLGMNLEVVLQKL